MHLLAGIRLICINIPAGCNYTHKMGACMGECRDAKPVFTCVVIDFGLKVHSNTQDVVEEPAENLTTILYWMHFTALI